MKREKNCSQKKDEDYIPYGKKNSYKRWTIDENRLYVEFLKNSSIIETAEPSKGDRLFKKMADKIQTKNNMQCRTHHQKLLLVCGSVTNIIEKFNFHEDSST